jgi:hypothetical protein
LTRCHEGASYLRGCEAARLRGRERKRAEPGFSHARAVIGLHNAWCGLRAMPRMLAYRGYGAAARGARALGLRRSRPVGTHAGNWASSPAGLTLCLTRGSISFERTLCEEDGFAGSSPAMTNGEVDANGKCSSISAARIVAMPKSLVIPTHCL